MEEEAKHRLRGKHHPDRQQALFAKMEFRSFAGREEPLSRFPEGTTPHGELDEQALEQRLPDLVRELAAFDPLKSLAAVAGLLTMPEFQANTIRLETLAKLIHRHARGKHSPTRNALDRWLNAKLGKTVAAVLEDPVEDVFISHVLCGMGNTRLFEGIWEGSDFHLQSALEALLAFPESRTRTQLIAESHALLALSDAVAEEAGLVRNTNGSGEHGKPMKLPSKAEIVAGAKRVILPVSRLTTIPELWPHLECFIHHAGPNAGDGMANSLVASPLVRIEDQLVLSLPSAVSPAIRMRILQVLGNNNEAVLYHRLVLENQVRRFAREVVPALRLDVCEDFEPVALPAEGPIVWQCVLTFDIGKYAHVVLLSERSPTDERLDGSVSLMPNEEPQTLDVIRRTRELLTTRKDYSGGLTLIVRAGLEANVRGMFESGGNAWHVSFMYLHDLLLLAHSNRFPLLRLWKTIEHRAELEANGIVLINMSGDVNLLAWAEKNSGRLVPVGAPLQADLAIHIPSNAIVDLRRELRDDYDEHAVPLPSQKCWRRVQRLAAEPLFEHVSRLPVYTVPFAEILESCAGVVETDERSWWLLSDYVSAEPGEARLFQHRLFEGMLLWLSRIAPRAEAEWSFPEGVAIEMRLTFKSWPLRPGMKIGDLPHGNQVVEIQIDQGSQSANLIVPTEFFHLFLLRENVAERRLIEAILQAAARLAGATLSQERASEISGATVGGPNARYLHAFEWGSLRLGHPAFRMIRALRADEWEKHRAELGMAHRVLKRGGITALETTETCHAFLVALCAELWTDIEGQLRQFDRVSTVKFALENFEGLEVAFEKWNVASASQLAIHGSGDEVHGILAREEHRRAEAALSSRILAEMAVCTCPIGGAPMTSAAFEALLAQTSLLLTNGALCDAYYYELATPPILIEPSGSWRSMSSFGEDIVRPFHRQTMREHYSSMATQYAQLFPSEGSEGDQSWLSEKQFVKAVKAELGISISGLMHFCEWILKDFGPSVAVTTINDFTKRAALAGFSENDLEIVWENLALRPRADWRVPPQGFKPSDIHPWRFNRHLSLLSRPFVITDIGGSSPILFAPVAVSHALELRLTRAYLGEAPQNYYRSSEMRTWADAVTHREGIAFEIETCTRFSNLGWHALASINMTALGGEKRHGNLDVLAWLPSSNVVALVECKRLLHARTVGEIAKRLIAFRGMQRDLLARHLARAAWLNGHRLHLHKITGIPEEEMRIVPLLVTNAIVPMQFVQSLPLAPSRIVGLHQLADRLPDIVAGI